MIQYEIYPGLLVGFNGIGKSTKIKDLEESYFVGGIISDTTRPIRPNEQDGVDYNYLSSAGFRRLVDTGDMFSAVELMGNFYGIRRSAVESIRDRGLVPMIAIDVFAVTNFKSHFPRTKAYFLEPEDIAMPVRRMVLRGDNENRILSAIRRSDLEIQAVRGPLRGCIDHHFMVNEDPENDIDINNQIVRLHPLIARA